MPKQINLPVNASVGTTVWIYNSENKPITVHAPDCETIRLRKMEKVKLKRTKKGWVRVPIRGK